MKKTFKWLGISALMITGIIGIVFLVSLYLLTPAKLTPIVNKYATEYLDAKINFDSVQVSLFEEFPKLSVKLVGGEIISYAMQSDAAFLSEHPAGVDTLMRFNEFVISLNIADLMQSKINIQRIRISQPNINAYVSPSGRANWEIYTSSARKTDDETPPLDLNIDRFAIQGPATLIYKSRPDSMALQASIGRLFLRGNITPDFDKLEISKFVCSNVEMSADIEKGDINAALVIDSATVDIVEQRREYNLKIGGMASATMEKQNYCDSLPLKLNGTLKLDPDNKNFFGFKDFALAVANLPEIKLNGDIILSEGDITSDLDCRVELLPVQSLLNLIPKGFSDEIQKIQTNIEINLNTSIKGSYKFDETGELPTVNVDFKIPKGQLIYKDSESKIDNIAIDASMHYDPASPQKTGIKFKKINVDAFAIKLNGSIDVTYLLDDPNVILDLKGSANLQELVKFAPEDLSIFARGNVSFDAKGSFLASRLNAQDLAKNDLVAQFSADRFRLLIPRNRINLLAEKTTIELNTSQTRTNRKTGAVSKLLNMELKSDTAQIRMPGQTVALSKVDFSMHTSDAIITGDTSRVMPMIGNIAAGTLEYSGADSATMRLRGIKSDFRILPSRENRTLPTIRFNIESRLFNVLTGGNRLSIRNASIALEATKNPPVQRQRRTSNQQRLDSLQKIYPHIQRDSLTAHLRAQRRENRLPDDFADEDLDIRDAELGTLLREWTITGDIKSRNGRIVSPYFPMRTRLQNFDLAFTTNDITLQNMTVKCGESKLDLTGKITGIRRALSTGRGLKIEADIKADTLNINELLTAAYNGSTYSESSDEYKKALENAEDEDQLENIIQKENENKYEVTKLVVIPSNVSVDIKLIVGHGKYADLIINKLTGELVSRDRCLQLKDIVAETNVGVIDMTALYATRSKKDITFGIDLEFENIQVEKFVDIIPAIDSLVPMLSSFKGIVNSQFAATAAIDSTMNIIMPSLNAACKISGKDMVLLDGETFTEISRKLRFKNRKENLVDSISVEMLIQNNQMEIFPFVMQMDRYKAAIGGVHNLDMTFNYHISVLKSPLPFSMGIDLSGNLDNMKFGLGKAKYKDSNRQVYVTMVDATRLNLRTQINNFIQQGVDAARFTQFSAPTIDTSLIEKDTEALSVQDSLILYKEGIIDVAPVLKDSIPSDDKQPRKRRSNRDRKSAGF